MSDEAQGSIALEQLGLAGVLKQFQLTVPLNQREYSWEKEHVEQMFDDLAEALRNGDEHFFGTIVTIPRQRRLEVVDGQQRLATTAILLAAMRDYLLKIDDEVLVESLNNEFLTGIHRRERQRIPKLALNADDNALFSEIVTGEDLHPSDRLTSHQRLMDAQECAERRVRQIVSPQSAVEHHGDILEDWMTFLEEDAVVILLRVPDDANAYKMFETLNDRGLRTSQVDLIKNFVFSKSDDRIQEVQNRWSYMRGTLEAFGEDDIVINFIRHALIAQYGHVTAAKVYERVRSTARTKRLAVFFVTALEQLAAKYVAILTPDHDDWSGYPSGTKKSLQALNLFDIKILRPLQLAIASRMTKKEASNCFQFLESVGVRLMVASSTRSGAVEQPLADVARKVWDKEVKTQKQLMAALKSIMPSDPDFESAFADLRVSNAKLARYYLRRLQEMEDPLDDEHALQEDTETVNLEHVLPKKPDDGWTHIDAEDHRRLTTRLGNLALMKKKENSDAKSAAFIEKKAVYGESTYTLTNMLADYDIWDEDAIDDRQRRLAALAPKVWAVK